MPTPTMTRASVGMVVSPYEDVFRSKRVTEATNTYSSMSPASEDVVLARAPDVLPPHLRTPSRPRSEKGNPVTMATTPGAGIPSTPRRIGKKITNPSYSAMKLSTDVESPESPRSQLYGDRMSFFQEGGKYPPPPEGPRRRIGVSKEHVLSGDYAPRTWQTTADEIGKKVLTKPTNKYGNGYVGHDARLAAWEKDGNGDGGWTPPGGWMRTLPTDAPQDSLRHAPEHSVLFNNDEDAFEVKTYSPTLKCPYGVDDEAIDRNTRPRVKHPTNIPCRPPGCGTGAPAPARHEWKAVESQPISAVVDPVRPSTLPRRQMFDPKTIRPRATPYTMFGTNPFHQENNNPISPQELRTPQKRTENYRL